MTIIESIDNYQRSKIEELRDALGNELLENTPLFNDDFSLLRWLIGWNFKIDDIVPKYTKMSNIMQSLKLNELEDIEDFDEINDYVIKLVPAAKYFPGGLMGYDKDGYVVVFQAIYKASPKELIKCGRVSDMYYMALIEFVLTYKLIKKQEKLRKRRLGIKVVCDTDAWSMDLLFMPAIKIYMNLIRFLQEMFPELAKTLIVINAPPMMSTIYQLFKPAFAEATREKIVFYGRDYKDKLLSEFGADNLFEKWGGMKVPSNGCPTGSLRVGHVPPKSLNYDPAKNPYHVDNKNLTKINVPARQTTEVSLVVEKLGSKIRWFFLTSSEIDFYIKKEDKIVWPKFRLSTEFVPEYGYVTIEESGTYTLVFDNTLSTFFSKDVKFNAYVE